MWGIFEPLEKAFRFFGFKVCSVLPIPTKDYKELGIVDESSGSQFVFCESTSMVFGYPLVRGTVVFGFGRSN
jgi:hypothetical protein